MGLVATSLFTLNLLLGLLLITKYRRTAWWNRMPARIKALDVFVVHNYTAYLALLVAFVHPVLLLFAPKSGFRVVSLAVPLLAPHQSFFYCLGALGFYGLCAVTLTSTEWVRKKLTNRAWKRLHFAAYAATPLFLIHGLLVDQHLTDKPPDLLDGEKILSEAGLLLLVISVVLRIRHESRKRASERFHCLKIAKVIVETADARSYVLDVPPDLRKTFACRPGQFLTFRVDGTDSYVKRSYSLSSAPAIDPAPIVTIKRVPGGHVSNLLLDTLAAGDEAYVLPPEGAFFQGRERQDRHYVLFGAGIGITPLYSILKTVLHRSRSRVSLFYLNRDENSIIFRDELETLAARFGDRLRVQHQLTRPGENWNGPAGRYSRSDLQACLNGAREQSGGLPSEYYVCGPAGYMDSILEVLEQTGVPADSIHRERFEFSSPALVDLPAVLRIGDVVAAAKEPRHLAGDAARASSLEVQLNRQRRRIDVRSGETLLDATLRAGLIPPFACQEGACASCKAALTKGRVAVLRHEALTPMELDQRNILTCQAIALSEHVAVSFDE